jgi:hypothetical protein
MAYFRTFILLTGLLLVFSHHVKGQLYFPEDMVNVTGQVVDENTGEKIPYAQVLNFRVRGSTMTDVNGKFSIQADPSDSLTFKILGYKDKIIPVKEVLSMSAQNKNIALTQIKYSIDSVQVEAQQLKMNLSGIPRGKSSKLPTELRSEDFDSNPGLLTVVIKPLSYLHYKLSSSEKEKRSTLAAIYSEQQWKILSLIYNKDLIQRLTFLTGDKLDDFMVYCNAYSGLAPNSTTYEVEKRIKDLYIEYIKLHPVLDEENKNSKLQEHK